MTGLLRPRLVLAFPLAVLLLALMASLVLAQTRERVEPPFQRGQILTGEAQAIDGDTIRIGNQAINIDGIDAMELGQQCTRFPGRGRFRCGDEARQFLNRLLRRGNLRCEIKASDVFARNVAECTVNGQDVGLQLVNAGWALARGAKGADYVAANRAARIAKRGIWAGEFVMPIEWRRRNERIQDIAFGGQAACFIKGNIERNGRRLYYVVYNRGYERTRVDLQTGERWFCSEQEARDAGWEKAPN